MGDERERMSQDIEGLRKRLLSVNERWAVVCADLKAENERLNMTLIEAETALVDLDAKLRAVTCDYCQGIGVCDPVFVDHDRVPGQAELLKEANEELDLLLQWQNAEIERLHEALQALVDALDDLGNYSPDGRAAVEVVTRLANARESAVRLLLPEGP